MKNKKAILLLFGANTVSGISQGISLIAIPWFIAVDLKKPSVMGGLFFAATLAAVFWGPYAGTLVDRFNRKRVMQVIQSIGLVAVLAIALYGFYIGKTTLAMACGIFIITKLIYNIHYPNLYAFAQEITEPEYYGKITSWIEIQGQTTFALAGATAAILMEGSLFSWHFGAWPVYQIFLLDAATYFIGFLLISKISFTSLANRKKFESSSKISEVIQFLKTQKVLFIFGNASYFLFAAILITSFFTVPIFISDYLHETEKVYGWVEGCFAFGSLFSGILVLKFFKEDELVKGVLTLLFTGGVLFLFIGFNTSIALFLLAYLIIGFCNAGIRILRQTYLFNHVPNHLIGRTGSVFMVINSMFRLTFVALFSLPFFAHSGNMSYSMIILSAFIFLGVLSLSLNYKKLT